MIAVEPDSATLSNILCHERAQLMALVDRTPNLRERMIEKREIAEAVGRCANLREQRRVVRVYLAIYRADSEIQ